MSRRSIFFLFFTLAVVVGWTGHGLAWGDVAYRRALEEAIDALPKPLKNFYKDRKVYLMQQLEDVTITAPRSVFEVDLLEPFPFDNLSLDRESAVRTYGEDKLGEVGDLPWRMLETYEKLTEAFRQMDLETIDMLSAELVLYVADLSQPLIVSKEGDGDMISQEGFRERFDSRLLDVYGSKLKVDASTAIYLDDPNAYIISVLVRSYVWVDNLLLYDYLSRKGVSSYDRFYYEGLWLRAEEIVNERISDAAEDVASYWYTAWSKAGRPDLPKD